MSRRSMRVLGVGVTSLLILASTSIAMAGAGLTTSSDKLFEGPVAGAAVLATIPAGSKVGILWCGMQQKWCLVNFHATQGFVSFSSLELIGGKAAGGDAGAGGASATGVPVSIAGSTLPPMTVVTGTGMAYDGGSKGAANLVTTIKHIP